MSPSHSHPDWITYTPEYMYICRWIPALRTHCYINSQKSGWRWHREQYWWQGSERQVQQNQIKHLSRYMLTGAKRAPKKMLIKTKSTQELLCCAVKTSSTVIQTVRIINTSTMMQPQCTEVVAHDGKACWLTATHSPPVRTRPTLPDSCQVSAPFLLSHLHTQTAASQVK